MVLSVLYRDLVLVIPLIDIFAIVLLTADLAAGHAPVRYWHLKSMRIYMLLKLTLSFIVNILVLQLHQDLLASLRSQDPLSNRIAAALRLKLFFCLPVEVDPCEFREKRVTVAHKCTQLLGAQFGQYLC